MNRTLVTWIGIFLIAGALIAYGPFFGGNEPAASITPQLEDTVESSPDASVRPSTTPLVSPRITQSVQSTPRITNNPIVGSPVPRNLINGPASCQLSGSIVFWDMSTYETRGAKIAYQNVDDTSRLINWSVTPNDGVLKIGPNIFAGLASQLPNGEKQVGVDIAGSPTVKRYTLTANITYGHYNQNGSEEVRTATCSGSVEVTLP